MVTTAVTKEFKNQTIKKLLIAQQKHPDSVKDFFKEYEITSGQFYNLEAGRTREVLTNSQWVTLGRKLGVSVSRRGWKIARTDVFNMIEEDVLFCRKYSKSRMFVDECAIGKSYSARYLSKTLRNRFYVDGSQGKSRMEFVAILAKAIGVDNKGKYSDMLTHVKYYLNSLRCSPVVIIDEAGDLNYNTLLVLQELWNATENNCEWYLMGADGLKSKIQKGIKSQKVGYANYFQDSANGTLLLY